MKKNGTARILCWAGTILVALPVVWTLITAVAGTIGAQRPHFDYLMPAELFPVVLAGSALLLWAAFRTRWLYKFIGWNLAVMLASLFVPQAAAALSGLASGRTEPAGPVWVFILACIAVYWATIILMGIAGVRLIKRCRSGKPGPG